MQNHDVLGRQMTRRLLLGAAGMGGLALLPAPARAEETVDLRVPGGPSTRSITTAYPQKGRMILQRTSPPWLETPFGVFDKGEPSIEIESRPGNAEFHQRAAHRQMGVLDELDDLQLFASRIPHAASSPSAVMLF
jgi:hypothetical protein